MQEEIVGLQMQNYWKQKEVYKKHNIDANITSTKQVVSKMAGLEKLAPDKKTVQDEDALMESLNNLDYLLVQQKRPSQEKQEAVMKLAEHMGLNTDSAATTTVVEKRSITAASGTKKPRGVRTKVD